MSYSQLMSHMSINPSVDTSGTQYKPPRVSSYRSLGPSTQVLKTQLDEVKRHEQPRRQIRSRVTYNSSQIKKIFGRRR
jgi:hypothetical protein